jgi:hypothetical protein
MAADFTVGQTALVVIAIATSIQTLLLLAGAWLAIRMWSDLRAKLEHRLDALQARLGDVADAARQMAGAIESGVNTTSTALQFGERLATVLATTVASPQTLLAVGVASKLLSSWRRWRKA